MHAGVLYSISSISPIEVPCLFPLITLFMYIHVYCDMDIHGYTNPPFGDVLIPPRQWQVIGKLPFRSLNSSYEVAGVHWFVGFIVLSTLPTIIAASTNCGKEPISMVVKFVESMIPVTGIPINWSIL